MKIYDAMIDMRATAIKDGRKPRRWEINDAGHSALMLDERIYSVDHGGNLIGKPFLGIPMTRMPLGTKNASTDPKVDLIVDEKTAAS